MILWQYNKAMCTLPAYFQCLKVWIWLRNVWMGHMTCSEWGLMVTWPPLLQGRCYGWLKLFWVAMQDNATMQQLKMGIFTQNKNSYQRLTPPMTPADPENLPMVKVSKTNSNSPGAQIRSKGTMNSTHHATGQWNSGKCLFHPKIHPRSKSNPAHVTRRPWKWFRGGWDYGPRPVTVTKA